MKGKGQPVENVSDIIAKACKIEPFFDPKLMEIFARKPQVIPDPLPSPKAESKKQKDKILSSAKLATYNSKPSSDEIKLSHRDAAAIRIAAKLKSRLAQSENRDEPDPPMKKSKSKKRKVESLEATVDEELEEESYPKRHKRDASARNGAETIVESVSKPKSATVNKSHKELNAPKEKDSGLEHRTIFIGNVPKEIKKNRLKKIFSQYGEIETIRYRGAAPAKPTMLKKVASMRNEIHPDSASIVAYIRYETRKEAKKASKKLNGYQLDEHYLTVDLADNKKRDNKMAIFVGNLHLKTQDDELRSIFAECGSIHSVRVIRDAPTGIGKGFGYINFENSDSVELALKLDGVELRNRPIRVKRAVKKQKVKRVRSQGVKQRLKTSDGSPGAVRTPPTPKIKKPTSYTPKVTAEVKVRPPKKEAFTGDCLSEIGKLKRKQKKPNKGDLKKVRIAQQLTGVKSKEVFQKKKPRHQRK